MEAKVVFPIAGFILAVLVFLHTLLVKRKEATIEGQDKEITRLKLLLDEAKNNSPDILAERYKRKIGRYEAELKELMSESEANSVAIKEKEAALQIERANVAALTEQMNRANEILEDYQYLKEQFSCPHCGAETTTLAPTEFDFYTAYACGYSTGGGYHNCPCPRDPEFPTFDEYEFEIRQTNTRWICIAKPKTKRAEKLHLDNMWGTTSDEAKTRVIQQYNSKAPKNKRIGEGMAPKQVS